MLIYSGFDPQKPDNFGSSPLHLACISGNLAAVKLLCAKVNTVCCIEVRQCFFFINYCRGSE
jgi:ankyrin repeat protein